MKEKIFNLIIIMVSIFIISQLLVKKMLVNISIMNAMLIWTNNLIPSLFPFFIISDILINYNITAYIPKKICNICKHIFLISDNMLIILFLSMISGFPSNARNTRTLYDKGLISLEEANHILIFSHFANPVFILSTIGVFFLGNKKVGIILLVSHYFSNFILGIIFRNSKIKFRHVTIQKESRGNLGIIIVNSIKKSIDTILLICGILITFMLFSEIVIETFNFNIYNAMLIKGFFEITIGIEALSKIKLSIMSKAVISSIILAFGGISVHMQVISQIAGTNIKYQYFLIGRIWQMIISGIITYFLWLFFIN